MAITEIDRNLIRRVTSGQERFWSEFVDRFVNAAAEAVVRTADTNGVVLTARERDNLVDSSLSTLRANDFLALRRFRGDCSLTAYVAMFAQRAALKTQRANLPVGAAIDIEFTTSDGVDGQELISAATAIVVKINERYRALGGRRLRLVDVVLMGVAVTDRAAQRDLRGSLQQPEQRLTFVVASMNRYEAHDLLVEAVAPLGDQHHRSLGDPAASHTTDTDAFLLEAECIDAALSALQDSNAIEDREEEHLQETADESGGQWRQRLRPLAEKRAARLAEAAADLSSHGIHIRIRTASRQAVGDRKRPAARRGDCRFSTIT